MLGSPLPYRYLIENKDKNAFNIECVLQELGLPKGTQKENLKKSFRTAQYYWNKSSP